MRGCLKRWRSGVKKRTPLAELFQMQLPGFGAAEAVLEPETTAPSLPPDWRERERALDVRASWIVEAPAGSGKTGLLIQRYLKLLAEGEVERPEQVLAITFTNAAAAEIRERVGSELEAAAARTIAGTSSFARETRALAEAVLGRDRERGWGLLLTPQRLNVRTIDSVCAEIARALPVTSGGATGLTPVKDPEPLYREAARRTLLELGGDDAALNEALRTLLLHRDGSVANCESLLAEMLGSRDQWGELVPFRGEQISDEVLDGTVRPRLDRALELAVCRGLGRLVRVLPDGFLTRLTEIASRLGDRPGYKGNVSPVAICGEVRSEPEAAAKHLSHWRALIHLVIAPSTSKWRKSFNENHMGVAIDKNDKLELKELLEIVQDNAEVLDALLSVSMLPPPRYPDDQWRVAKALFRVLGRALAELKVLFAERSECDFAEPAMLALQALRERRGTEGLETVLGVELRHLLVDEMQDTSTSQYELIELLTEGWDSEGRTVFLVGDPKQSIYLFRQARVERFVATMESGRLGDLQLGTLHLAANFRSQAGLVAGFNATFSEVFLTASENREDVTFVQAEAVRPAAEEGGGESGFAWHTDIAGGTGDELRDAKVRAARRNALAIRRIAERWRGRPLPEGRSKPWRVAVLVRSRRELRGVVAALEGNASRPALPFRAVDVEPLKERREVLDLLALTRALKHPADRVAWWAVLRAPWCGLRLSDLHVLSGSDDEQFAELTVMELVQTRGELLEPDGIERLQRVWPVLESAVGKRSRLRVPELVERTWRSLGGDAALDVSELLNATRFLQLLEEVDRELGQVEVAQVRRRMERLFAAPAGSDPSTVDLMTIHGAKGLEWDVVMVPELEGAPPATISRLLEWEEVVGAGEAGAAGVVLAPIASKGESADALSRWIRGVRAEREAAERRRLLYVACTRAREELHLFATANRSSAGEVKPESRSLLEAAWPAAEGQFGRAGEVVAWPEADVVEEVGGLALAAAAGEEEMRPVLLERLPMSFDAIARFQRTRGVAAAEDARPRRERPEGSFGARSLGNAVHAFLEVAATHLAAGAEAKELLAEVAGWKERVAAVLRADGLRPADVEANARRVIAALSTTLREPVGLWLLEARADARSEYALTVFNEGWQRVRMDRVFRAGASPGEAGDGFLWIVDYKTGSHGSGSLETYLQEERGKYVGQMEGYARAFPGEEVRVGLWYPMLGRLEWWVAV